MNLVRLSLEIDYPSDMYNGTEDLSIIYNRIINAGIIEPLTEEGYSSCNDKIFHPAWASHLSGTVYSRNPEHPKSENGRSPVFIFCGPYNHQLFIWLYGTTGHFMGPETECWVTEVEIAVLATELQKVLGIGTIKIENHIKDINSNIKYEWHDIVIDLS